MSAEETIPRGLAPAGPLPRGRHGIPPELVVANQRERLFAATARGDRREGLRGAPGRRRDLARRASRGRPSTSSSRTSTSACSPPSAGPSTRFARASCSRPAPSQAEWPLAVAAAVSARDRGRDRGAGRGPPGADLPSRRLRAAAGQRRARRARPAARAARGRRRGLARSRAPSARPAVEIGGRRGDVDGRRLPHRQGPRRRWRG